MFDLWNVLQQGSLWPPKCPTARSIVTSGMSYSKVHCDLRNVQQQGSLWPPECPTARFTVTSGMSYSKGLRWSPECPTARCIVTSGMFYSKVHCDLRNVLQQGSWWPPECPTARFMVTSGMFYSKVHGDFRTFSASSFCILASASFQTGSQLISWLWGWHTLGGGTSS